MGLRPAPTIHAAGSPVTPRRIVRQTSRERHYGKAAAREVANDRRTDQSGGAENATQRRRIARFPGLPIMSPRMASLAPKPGKTKANQTRNQRW
jgi:hypothetical protein